MNDEQLVAAIDQLQKMTEGEREAWLNANGSKLNQSQAERLALAFPNSRFAGKAEEIARGLYKTFHAQWGKDRAQSEFVDQNPQFDDGTGRIDQSTPEGRAAADQFGVNRTITDEEGAFIEAFGGTEEAALRALDFINEQYDQGFTSISEFVESDMWANATYRRQVTELFGGEQTPESSWSFNLPRGEKHVVTVAEAAKAQEAFGIIKPEEINYFVKAAYANDLRDATGRLNWQISAAFQTFSGYSATAERDYRTSSRQLLLKEADIRRQIREIEGGMPVKGRAAADRGNRLADLQRQLSNTRAELQRLAVDPGRILKPKDLTERYKKGMELYNSESTAFFHALDEGLAARMAGNKTLSREDARLALGLMQRAGIKGEDATSFAETMYDLGFVDPMATAWADAMAEAEARANGGSERVRIMPDPVMVRQSAKDFYRQMFLEEPDDATLDRFSADVSSAIVAAADDEAVDVNARIRGAAEKLPQYKKYYGKKPGGMSEEEYQGMFRAAQASMLGDELADNQAVRMGMREGQYQTTVGAAIGTKEAWDNSTFLGRLARAAQAVSRNT